MNTASETRVYPEPTPNPESVKFNVQGQEILKSGGVDFETVDAADKAPLAQELFKSSQVQSVFLGTGFVTVTKTPVADWLELIPSVSDTITGFFESGQSAIDASFVQPESTPTKEPTGADAEVAKKIRHVLDTEIRPAVARDGGDVTFEGYEDGKVTLQLRGSCATCPSALMTLKMGVERRLREAVPEVQEVIQA